MRKDYDIVGSYDNQRITTINAERSVNLFEYLDPDGKRPKSLLPTAGLINSDIDLDDEMGGARAAFVFNNAIYQVYGSTVFRTTGSTGFLLTSKIGTLPTSAGYVGIDANTFQVIIVDGQTGWIWDDNTQTFVKITDTSFPSNPIDVCYLDGFFVVANGNTNNFQLSMFNQGLVWGPDFTTPTPDAFLATSGASPNLVLTTASTTKYPVGSSVAFSGAGTLPTGTPAIALNTTYYVKTVVDGSTFTISTTVGGTATTFSTTGVAPIFVKNTSIGNGFVATSGNSPNLVLSNGTTLNYQIGTPVQFSGNGTLPTGTPTISKNTTYYVKRVINATTFTISTTDGGTEITFSSTGTAPIYVSNNGQLQLGSITSHPGTIVACRTLHRRIFLFSQNFTEVWENAGAGTNLPFRRNNSLLMEVGTPALGSVSVGFDCMFFLAQDKDGLAGVMEVKGTESILVSNRALDFQLAQYAADPATGVADARGVLIKENGLIFYRLNFTLANHTFVLNVTMSTDKPRWHEEEVLNGDRHPAQTHAYFDGVNYYGSYKQATFYIVSDDTSTNDGEVIRRMRIGRQMTPEGYNRLRIDRFQLDLLQGSEDIDMAIEVDLLTELSQDILTESSINIILEDEEIVAGNQPHVFLSISRDGGQTYGNKLIANMGKLGERTFRTVWRKLGTTPRGQGYVPRIEFFNTIPFIILGASWDFEDMPE
jgi:hypothetical protein